MVGSVPDRKKDGRGGPLPGYPRDPRLYADPTNWKYPIHTPFHARAARRYFDRDENRKKYTEEEQKYIDWRIEQALKRFGVIEGRRREDRAIPFRKRVDDMTLNDLLIFFLGRARLTRARRIPAEGVSFDRVGEDLVLGRVKEYDVRIDAVDKRIVHSCPDWDIRAGAGLMCKHLARFFLSLPEDLSLGLLRRLITQRETWIFQSKVRMVGLEGR